MKNNGKKSKGKSAKSNSGKRPAPVVVSSQSVGGKGQSVLTPSSNKKPRKSSPKGGSSTKKKKTPIAAPSNPAVLEPGSENPVNRQKTAAAIAAVNAASGGKNDRAAALAAAILRGVTMRPSGKWVRSWCYYLVPFQYVMFLTLSLPNSKHNSTMPANLVTLESLTRAKRQRWHMRLREKSSSQTTSRRRINQLNPSRPRKMP